jgi:hypothetical protein
MKEIPASSGVEVPQTVKKPGFLERMGMVQPVFIPELPPNHEPPSGNAEKTLLPSPVPVII